MKILKSFSIATFLSLTMSTTYAQTENEDKVIEAEVVAESLEHPLSREQMEKQVDALLNQDVNSNATTRRHSFLEVISGIHNRAIYKSTLSSALVDAVRDKNPTMVEVLLSRGANPNGLKHVNRFDPLTIAVRNNDYFTAQLLLDAGAAIEGAIKYKWNRKYNWNAALTPLHIAIQQNNIDMVKLLLEGKANPNFLYPGSLFLSHPLSIAKTEEMRSLLRSYGARSFLYTCRSAFSQLWRKK